MHDRVAGLMERLDIEGKTRRIEQLEAQAAAPDFWSNPDTAQKVMQQIARLRGEVEHWNKLLTQLRDAVELAQLEDPSVVDELTAEAERLRAEVERMALQTMLSGEYDDSNAILAIHAGAGGTDSQDWA
ncbi:MAG: PCRF domain-containing protein, partial [Anaerolinea sp.]|nr:PCRF domain-containing protein [Anaerolinea sp.]